MRRSTELLQTILDDLFSDDALIEAVVRDGWPRPMVVEGFAMHRRTWNPRELERAIDDELGSVAVDDCVLPQVMAHLWPALPGAGVTPLLYSWLVGVPEIRVKPSSRGVHFARHFVDVWRRHDDAVELVDGDQWTQADHVVVSGTDETIAAVEARVGKDRVTGYGHRISLAIIEADGDELRWVEGLAADIVMWHQQGCFSCRGIWFVGDDSRPFAEALGEAIAAAEVRLGAELTEDQLVHRMQHRGAAEFETEVYGSGLGWVELRDSVDGRWISPHTVVLTTSAVGGPGTLIQGIAIGASSGRFAHWSKVAGELGATRVCRPGELQAPPAAWPHDGHPNVRGWLCPVQPDPAS